MEITSSSTARPYICHIRLSGYGSTAIVGIKSAARSRRGGGSIARGEAPGFKLQGDHGDSTEMVDGLAVGVAEDDDGQ